MAQSELLNLEPYYCHISFRERGVPVAHTPAIEQVFAPAVGDVLRAPWFDGPRQVIGRDVAYEPDGKGKSVLSIVIHVQPVAGGGA